MDGKLTSFSRLFPAKPALFLQALLLAAVSGALLLTRLSCPLLEPEETRYAEIPRQMLAEGRFLEPVWHGEPYYHKPPLLYWLVMASYTVFGVHDWAARLVPALASFATVVATWLWGYRVAGPRAGFGAAVMLLLSSRFVYLGRMLTIDALLTLWVTAALTTAHVAIVDGKLRWRWWLCSALLTGLGLLTKGPVALVLVAVPVVLFQWLDRPCARFSPRALACYIALAACVAAPWYVGMAVLNADAAVDFFWLHHVQRFLDPLDHEEPWWFFLPGLLWGTLPWSLLLVPLVMWLARQCMVRVPCPRLCVGMWGKKNMPTQSRGHGTPAGPMPQALSFALVSLGWCVLFFSASACKRPVYILPALPWLAASLGCCWAFVPLPTLRWLGNPRLGCGLAALVFVVLFVGVLEWLPTYHRRFALRGQVRRHVENASDVFCYPKRWDGVSFYLQHDKVRIFAGSERAALIAALQERPGALVFVKTRHLNELLSELPPWLELVAVGRQSERLTVWRAQPRLASRTP